MFPGVGQKIPLGFHSLESLTGRNMTGRTSPTSGSTYSLIKKLFPHVWYRALAATLPCILFFLFQCSIKHAAVRSILFSCHMQWISSSFTSSWFLLGRRFELFVLTFKVCHHSACSHLHFSYSVLLHTLGDDNTQHNFLHFLGPFFSSLLTL